MCEIHVNHDGISVVTGVFWSKIDKVVMYESSIPLKYQSEFKTLGTSQRGGHVPRHVLCGNEVRNSNCQASKYLVELNENYQEHFMLWKDSINSSTIIGQHQQHKKKRSLDFVGEALDWCCGVIGEHRAEQLFENEDNLKKSVDQLVVATQGDHEELTSLIRAIHNYDLQMGSTLKQNSEAVSHALHSFDLLKRIVSETENSMLTINDYIFQEIIRQAIDKLELLYTLSQIQILNQCRNNKIPLQIIQPSRLKSDLNKLNQVLRRQGKQLVISPEEISKYFLLNIAHCKVSNNKIRINVQVPIHTINHNWELFRLLNVPFAWHEKTCIFSEKEIYAAKSQNKTIIISGTNIQNCNYQKDHLCLIPRVSTLDIENPACFAKLTQGATVADLITSCAVSCYATNKTLVQQLSIEKFLITHSPRKLLLQCKNNSREIQVTSTPTLGAVELHIPCFCSVSTRGTLLISSIFPCDANSIPSITIKHLLPVIWTKFQTLHLDAFSSHTSLHFNNLSECVNNEWHIDIPHFNFEPIQEKVLIDNVKYSDNTFSLYSNDFHYFPILKLLNIFVIIIVFAIVFKNPYLLGIGMNPRYVKATSSWHNDLSDVCNILILLMIAFIIIVILYVKLKKYFVVRNNKKSKDTCNPELDSMLAEHTIQIERPLEKQRKQNK